MATDITDAARSALQQINIEPHIVLQIDGVDTIYGAAQIREIIRVGDPGLLIGDDWVIGGSTPIDDQEDLITMEGTSNEINQQLNPDKGAVSSISSLTIALVDVGAQITRLITPGEIVEDLLGRRAKVWLGLTGTSYPEDYIPVFRGVIDDITSDQGKVLINIAAPEQKKSQTLFTRAETILAASVSQSFVEANVNVGTSVITVTAHGKANGDPVKLDSNGVLPLPLKKNKTYYLLNVATDTIQLAEYEGGPAIALSTDGTPDGTVTHQLIKGGIKATDTTIALDDASAFLVPVNGPSGANDTSLRFYIRINDEVIEYTGRSVNNLTGCVRGSLGTIAVPHAAEDEVKSIYRLNGNGVELALKVMLSGWNGPFESGITMRNFERISSTELIDNAIFFDGVDLVDLYGLTIGDFITTTGAANGANNVSLKEIEDIVVDDTGTYLVISDVTFVEELDTAGTIAFRSQYDTLGEGLMMRPDEVDIAEHLRWFRLFLSSFDFDHYLKDTINGKDFIEKQIFLPMGAYSLPRKTRSSMGYHSSPIPNGRIVTLDHNSVTNPTKLKKRRAVGKNFYNTIVYKMEEDILDERFLFGHIATSQTSKDRIPVGNKTLLIEANGMRRDQSAETQADLAATRLLNRYKFGAEFLEGVEVLFSVGVVIECGDIVLLDGRELNLSDTITGTRGAEARLYEVINKRLNIKTGKVALNLVDTNFSTANRYGLISPASNVKSGSTQKVFIIESSYSSVYGANEGRKWDRYIGCSVKVRNADGSVSGTGVILSVSGNQVTLETNLGFTPASGYKMELSDYDDQPEVIKLIYTFMNDGVFGDGKEQYKMA